MMANYAFLQHQKRQVLTFYIIKQVAVNYLKVFTDDDGRVHDVVLQWIPPRVKSRFVIWQFENAALGKAASED